MSAYATKEMFRERFPNTEMTDEQMISKLQAASVDVDALTFNRITACGFDMLTDFQKSKVINAVCCQAEFRFQNQELFDSPIASYSLNGASVTFDKSRLITVGGAITSADIYAELKQSGLCVRRL